VFCRSRAKAANLRRLGRLTTSHLPKIQHSTGTFPH